jgi:hypothetical protein
MKERTVDNRKVWACGQLDAVERNPGLWAQTPQKLHGIYVTLLRTALVADGAFRVDVAVAAEARIRAAERLVLAAHALDAERPLWAQVETAEQLAAMLAEVRAACGVPR